LKSIQKVILGSPTDNSASIF